MTFFVVGCGVNRPSSSTWPATVVKYQGFSQSEQDQIGSGIASLNTALGTQAITVDTSDTSSSGYPITIEKATSGQSEGSRAGYALVEDNQCTVQLDPDLFQTNKNDYFKSVLWHELGHCAGLQHVSSSNELMSPIAVGFSNYSKEALTRFYKSFLSSVGM